MKRHFMTTHAVTADPVWVFATDVRAGLTREGQKELPSKYLYDDVGSALFEVISSLPEYGLTRADERLFREYIDPNGLRSRSSITVGGSPHIDHPIIANEAIDHHTVDIDAFGVRICVTRLEGRRLRDNGLGDGARVEILVLEARGGSCIRAPSSPSTAPASRKWQCECTSMVLMRLPPTVTGSFCRGAWAWAPCTMPQPQNTMPAAAVLRKSRRVVMHSSLVVFLLLAVP